MGYVSGMKSPALALAAIAFSNCASSEPVDCRVVQAQMPACLERFADRGGRAFLVGCQPYSEPQRIAGTFVEDFEFNEFFEGRRVSPDRAWQFPERSTRLDIERPLHLDAAGNPMAIVTYLVFEGRRPLCDLIPEERWLIVDRIVSEQPIQVRQSEWYR